MFWDSGPIIIIIIIDLQDGSVSPPITNTLKIYCTVYTNRANKNVQNLTLLECITNNKVITEKKPTEMWT